MPVNIKQAAKTMKRFLQSGKQLTIAEKLGLPKGERNNLTQDAQLALSDLEQYINSGQHRQIFRVTPDWEDFGWDLDQSNPSFMAQFVKDNMKMRGPFARVLLQTPTGRGAIAYNPERNMAGYSSRMFETPEGYGWAPGEANMMLDGPGQKLVLTSPKVDADAAIWDTEVSTSDLPNTIDKNIMKDFWINARKIQRPGSYLSGDNGAYPLGERLIEAYKRKQLYKTPVAERPIAEQFVRRDGLSPDSYSAIIRQGNRDGSLRWGEGFTKWNNSAVENKHIYDSWRQMLKGEITPREYIDIFNNWSEGIGGRPIITNNVDGKLQLIHPHPYIYKKKYGGTIKKFQ